MLRGSIAAVFLLLLPPLVKEPNGDRTYCNQHFVARVPQRGNRDPGPSTQPAFDDDHLALAVREDFRHLFLVDALRVRHADLDVQLEVVISPWDELADRRDGVELDGVAGCADCGFCRVLSVAITAKPLVFF